MEATATWMEDEAYPEINDYLNYLYAWDDNGTPDDSLDDSPDGWFYYPQQSLATFDGWREYGSVLFPKYLRQKKSSQSVIRTIWESLDNYNFSTTGNSVIKKIGVPFSSSYSYNPVRAFNNIYSDFMAQNYIINPGDNSSSAIARYSVTDAVDIGDQKIYGWTLNDSLFITPDDGFIWEKNNSVGPISTKEVSSLNIEAPRYLGTNYNVIIAPATTRTFEFRFNSKLLTTKWAVKLLLRRVDDDKYVIVPLVPTGGTSGVKDISEFGASGKYYQAIIVASVVDPRIDLSTGHGYKYYGKINTTVTLSASSYKIRKGSKVKLYGRVSPRPGGSIHIQRYISGVWKDIKTIYPSYISSTGGFTYYWTAPITTGMYKFRAVYKSNNLSKYSAFNSLHRTITVY